MKNSCPSFVCLAAEEKRCDRYPACIGCKILYNCDFCANQTTLINGKPLSCDMVYLPSACRACPKRSSENFSPVETCQSCPHHKEKTAK